MRDDELVVEREERVARWWKNASRSPQRPTERVRACVCVWASEANGSAGHKGETAQGRKSRRSGLKVEGQRGAEQLTTRQGRPQWLLRHTKRHRNVILSQSEGWRAFHIC